WRSRPVDVANDHRDDARLVSAMALEGRRHFPLVTVVGGHEVRADEQQNDVGSVEVLIDRGPPLVARADVAIVPQLNEALTLQQLQVGLELVSVQFVTM